MEMRKSNYYIRMKGTVYVLKCPVTLGKNSDCLRQVLPDHKLTSRA